MELKNTPCLLPATHFESMVWSEKQKSALSLNLGTSEEQSGPAFNPASSFLRSQMGKGHDTEYLTHNKSITVDRTDIKQIIREYYEQLYVSLFYQNGHKKTQISK